MQRFDMSRARSPFGRSGADPRPSALAFGVGLVMGFAIGAFLGTGLLRSRRAANGQAFVDLTEASSPVAATGATQDREAS
jgi:hypothetical protein